MTGRQLPLFNPPVQYPSEPGFKESGTSKDAAERVAPKVETLRQMVLDSLAKRGPGTPDQVAARLKQHPLSIRPRFTELSKLGLIEKTGARRPNASGSGANVWRLR